MLKQGELSDVDIICVRETKLIKGMAPPRHQLASSQSLEGEVFPSRADRREARHRIISGTAVLWKPQLQDNTSAPKDEKSSSRLC